MDIAKLSMQMSQANLGTAIGAKVLSMSLDSIDAMSGAMLETMGAMPSPSLESLVDPSIGGNIDLAI